MESPVHLFIANEYPEQSPFAGARVDVEHLASSIVALARTQRTSKAKRRAASVRSVMAESCISDNEMSDPADVNAEMSDICLSEIKT
jgi:hypothetical protein